MRPNSKRALAAAVGILIATAIPASATFPGKNGRIAFGRFDPQIGWFRLYTANADGTDVRPLTHSASSFSDWSPDGKRIAFDFFDSDGNEQIATINPDGSELKQITTGPGIHEVPSWSPDGSEIAFDYSPQSPNNPNFSTSIYVMNADGSNPHQITQTIDTFDVEPKFSPDGTQIVFVRIKQDQLANDFQPEAVFIMNSDGTSVRQLTPWGNAEHPTWSPDGRWITFDFDFIPPSQDQPSVLSDIFRIRPNGADLQILFDGKGSISVHKPIFSPDQRKLLFGCNFDLCVMNLDSSKVSIAVHSVNGLENNYPSWGGKSD